MRNRILAAALLAGAMLAAGGARAETPADFLKSFETSARQTDPKFAGFSAQRGEQFFNKTYGGEWSCASCHTQNPAATGKHAKTGKEVKPLAPAANAERFASAEKVEKWFKRNCNDVLSRACSAQEKGDVLAYLMTVKR
jgi:mono/diheme cytochrome c family protein